MCGIDPLDSEGNDFSLDLDQHSMKWLVATIAEFRLKSFQSRNRSQLIQKKFNLFFSTCHKHIDPFGTQKDRAS